MEEASKYEVQDRQHALDQRRKDAMIADMKRDQRKYGDIKVQLGKPYEGDF